MVSRTGITLRLTDTLTEIGEGTNARLVKKKRISADAHHVLMGSGSYGFNSKGSHTISTTTAKRLTC